MPEVAMRVQRLGDLSAADAARRLARSAAATYAEETRVYARQVLEDVARDGDAAVVAYTRQWDGIDKSPDALRVRRERFVHARRAVAPDVGEAIEAAIARSRAYNAWLRPPALALDELEPGVTVGIRYTACRSAGLYVPSGKGTFPSMLVAMGTPAVVAGVERVAVVVPPRPDGEPDPAVLVAAERLGLDEVYCCNGAAGVAALAVGTQRIPRTDLVVGPGNPVVAAVQLAAAAYGARPLVMLGPTEAVVVADDSADPARLALDLLTEAEHGSDSAVLLLCTDERLAADVAARLGRLLARLPDPRRTYAARALSDLGGLFVVESLDEALDWVNRYAPEHLQLAVRAPMDAARRVRHAGEVLLGQHTPFAAANYAIGVPAALPTGGAAVAASGITVLAFLKTTSIAALSDRGLCAVAPVAERLGRHEGFPAHVLAVTEREVGA